MKKEKVYRLSIITAFGIIFLISATIIPIQNLILWGPEFLIDFYTSSDIIAEKISIGVIALGFVLILLGYKKQVYVE